MAKKADWLYYYIVKNHLRDNYNYKIAMKNVRLAFFIAPILYIAAIALAWVHTYITFTFTR